MPNKHYPSRRDLILALTLCAATLPNAVAAEAQSAPPAATAPSTASTSSDAAAIPKPRIPAAPADPVEQSNADSFDPSESISEDATVPYPVDI